MAETKTSLQLPIRISPDMPHQPQAAEPAVSIAPSVWQPQLSSASASASGQPSRGVWQQQAPTSVNGAQSYGAPNGYDPNMGNPNGYGYGGGMNPGMNQGMNPMVGAALGAVGGVMLYHGVSSMLGGSGGYHQPSAAATPSQAADGGAGGGDSGYDSGLGQESGADFTEV